MTQESGSLREVQEQLQRMNPLRESERFDALFTRYLDLLAERGLPVGAPRWTERAS